MFSTDFPDTSYNGYYVINTPASVDGFLTSSPSTPYIQSYKHLSRNLYLFADFDELDENNSGYYNISETPYNQDCIKHSLRIQVKHITDVVGLENMGERYCFAHAAIEKVDFRIHARNRPQEILPVTKYDVRPLTKQCGMTYRGSENTILSTGIQPFVLKVTIYGIECVGTLISPMHILTLATCFTLEKDHFDIESNVIRRCGMKKGWKNCKRWFALNRKDKIEVSTYENIHGNKARFDVQWFEIHPLFNGQEFDLAIIALSTYIQRSINLHPICLPKWNIFDIEGNPTNEKLYKSVNWENYQLLYSLKALQRDVRFYTPWTDVNGPSKFMVRCCQSGFTLLTQRFQECKLSENKTSTSNWKEYCHLKNKEVNPMLPLLKNMYF